MLGASAGPLSARVALGCLAGLFGVQLVAEHVFAHPCMNDREVAHRQHSENMSAANEALRAGGDALRPVLRAGGVPDGYYHSDYWSEYGARLALQNAADGA